MTEIGQFRQVFVDLVVDRQQAARFEQDDGEGREIGRHGVDAERAAGDFIFAQCFPRSADGQTAQADRGEVRDERQDEDDVVEENDPVKGRVLDPEEAAECAGITARIELEAEEARAGNAGQAVPWGGMH